MRQDAHSFTTVFPLFSPSPAISGWKECHGRQREDSKPGLASDWLYTLSESQPSLNLDFPFWVQKGVGLDALPFAMPPPFQIPQQNRTQGARAAQVLPCRQPVLPDTQPRIFSCLSFWI